MARFGSNLYESVVFLIDLFKDVLAAAARTSDPPSGGRPAPGGGFRIG